MTPEERINQELAFIQPIMPAWENSDGSYSILLPRTNFNGWMWWYKNQHGALLEKTDLQRDFILRKVTNARRGTFLCFELKAPLTDEQDMIVITNEADLQRFNDEMRGKWREEHAAVIDEWKALTNNNE